MLTQRMVRRVCVCVWLNAGYVVGVVARGVRFWAAIGCHGSAGSLSG